MPRAGLYDAWWVAVVYFERNGPAKLKTKTSPAKDNPTKALLFRLESLDVGLPLVEKCLGPRGRVGK